MFVAINWHHYTLNIHPSVNPQSLGSLSKPDSRKEFHDVYKKKNLTTEALYHEIFPLMKTPASKEEAVQLVKPPFDMKHRQSIKFRC